MEQTLLLSDETLIQATPLASSPILVQLPSDQSVKTFGRFGRARHIETETGLRGWIVDSFTTGGDEPAS